MLQERFFACTAPVSLPLPVDDHRLPRVRGVVDGLHDGAVLVPLVDHTALRAATWLRAVRGVNAIAICVVDTGGHVPRGELEEIRHVLKARGSGTIISMKAGMSGRLRGPRGSLWDYRGHAVARHGEPRLQHDLTHVQQ